MRIAWRRAIPFLAIPLTVGACSVLTWIEKPDLLHRLVQHPLLCVGLGVIGAIILVAALLVFFTWNEDMDGNQKYDDTLNIVARELRRRDW